MTSSDLSTTEFPKPELLRFVIHHPKWPIYSVTNNIHALPKLKLKRWKKRELLDLYKSISEIIQFC